MGREGRPIPTAVPGDTGAMIERKCDARAIVIRKKCFFSARFMLIAHNGSTEGSIMLRTIGQWVTRFGLFMGLCLAAQAHSATDDAVLLKIHAPTITAALIQFSQQTGLQLALPTDNDSASRVAPVIEGLYTPSAALEAILRDSGLTYRFVNPRTIAISLGGRGASAVNNLASTPMSRR